MKAYYQHGGVTIYHGDCREFAHLASSEAVIITDPPYGVNVCLGVGGKGGNGGMWKGVKLAGDSSVALACSARSFNFWGGGSWTELFGGMA